jgi:predicted ribosome quality control (RQC) complex YloA/Tae2 family protein
MKADIFEYDSIEYNILIGTNKYENFQLIDNAVDTDIWFHVENEPSCHVILKNDSRIHDIPKQVIKRCAYLCKINSKSKIQNKSYIMYTQIKNVTKTEIIGQVNVTTYKVINV